jgi:hypothetical protein
MKTVNEILKVAVLVVAISGPSALAASPASGSGPQPQPAQPTASPTAGISRLSRQELPRLAQTGPVNGLRMPPGRMVIWPREPNASTVRSGTGLRGRRVVK